MATFASMETKLLIRRGRAIDRGPTPYMALTIVPPPTLQQTFADHRQPNTGVLPVNQNDMVQGANTLVRDRQSRDTALPPTFVGRTCFICLDLQATVAIFGCGHVAFCNQCSTNFKDKATVQRCPLCDRAVLDNKGNVQLVSLH